MLTIRSAQRRSFSSVPVCPQVIAETSDFKGVWDGGGKDSTHFIRRLEKAGEIPDRATGRMIPFSARTPYRVFDVCRREMPAPKPKSNAEKLPFTFDKRIFRYATCMPDNETCVENGGHFDRDDPDVIVFDRDQSTWNASGVEGSKQYKVFMNATMDKRIPTDGVKLACRSLLCPCPPCLETPVDTSKCLCLEECGEYDKHAIFYQPRPEHRVSERILNEQRLLKQKSLAQKAAMLKGKINSILAFGAGDGKFWLARVLDEPEQWKAQSKQMGSGSTKWWLKKDDWFLRVMWLKCVNDAEQHYVEEAADTTLVEGVVFTTEELCLTEEEVCRGSGRKCKWEDVLALAPDSKRLIKEAGLGQFAIQ